MLSEGSAVLLSRHSASLASEPEFFGSGRTFTDMTACPSLDTPTIHRVPYKALSKAEDRTDIPPKLLEQLETGPMEGSRKKGQAPVSELDTEANLKAADELIDNWPEVPHGERNDSAFKVASAIKDIGLSYVEVFDRMLKWNDEKCKPALDDDELETTTKSAYRSGNPPGTSAKADPLDEFDAIDVPATKEDSGPRSKKGFEDDPVDLWADESFPPDLPPGLLPPVLDKFVTDESERKGVERGAVALAALVACAAAIPAGYEMQVKQRDTRPQGPPDPVGGACRPARGSKNSRLERSCSPTQSD